MTLEERSMALKKSREKTAAKKKYTVHVLSGTHWDREWRYTAEQSKLRLAVLIDHLLDLLDREPRFRCYHLDGGSVGWTIISRSAPRTARAWSAICAKAAFRWSTGTRFPRLTPSRPSR
jgi:hypothetical protein